MRDQTNKQLHDWVRQSLETYRPDYNPTDWVRMQRTLRHRRWFWWSMLSVAGLFLIGGVGWYVSRPRADEVISRSHLQSQTHPSPSKESNKGLNLLTTNGLPDQHRQTKSVSFLSSQQQPPIGQASASTLGIPLTVLKPTHELKELRTSISAQLHYSRLIAYSPEETAITKQMLTGDFGADSTSYRALARNIAAWPDAVVVCDLTTSMYPYTTQLFAWFRKNKRNPAIKGMVFFTDCDSLGQQTRPGGPSGRMFVTRDRQPVSALPILLDAARNTIRNSDDAENDVEALLVAQNKFPEARHLILLADNISTVKDMDLLHRINKPVHVVLCGTTGSDTSLAFQPDYFTIASRTHGSLHTLEDDLAPSALSAKTTLRVGDHYYRYRARKKQFKRTPFDHRPKRFLKLIWF